VAPELAREAVNGREDDAGKSGRTVGALETGGGGQAGGFEADSLFLGRGPEDREGALGVHHGGGQGRDKGSVGCHDDDDDDDDDDDAIASS
jgi:hypothetical protein